MAGNIWIIEPKRLYLRYKSKGKGKSALTEDQKTTDRIKVDWETLQINMKYRDKLSRHDGGLRSRFERELPAQVGTRQITKYGEHSNPVYSEFHRIL